ncbi:MAG: RNA polymerase sigma factor [Planctomycetota bacterium]|jgi:RNA polymerase sigma-70 factor (ECF subfamily)
MDSRVKNLCKRAKRADKTAASELLKIFYADIFAYLRRLCRSRQDAEDLTQQTFLKIWRSIGSFRGNSRFSTWAYRIAYNTFIDWQRRNNDIQSRTDQWWEDCVDENPGPFTNAAQRQTATDLYKAVEQLDDDKKHIVHLRYYQGLSLKETAKVLNVSTSTVKYRLREVIKILRAQIGAQENEFNQGKAISIAKGELI